MAADTPTAKVHRLGEHRDGREDSDSFAQAAVDWTDDAIRRQFGKGLPPDAKAFVTSEIKDYLERVTTKTRVAAGTDVATGGRVGWFVAALLGCVLFVGALVATWDKIRTVESQQAADSEYAMIVAHWLVEQSRTNYTRTQHLDAMMRIIAAQIGADVSPVPPPEPTQPPTAIQRRSNDYLLSIGE